MQVYKTTEAQRLASRLYYDSNKATIAERYKSLSPERRARRNANSKAWRENNKERKAQADKKWRDANRSKWRSYRKAPANKTTSNLRKRFRELVKSSSMRTSQLIGCSPQELRIHLEEQFKEGMSWNNYGDWHIDHVIPCARFNLKNRQEAMACFHYTNLRPLWAAENILKGAK